MLHDETSLENIELLLHQSTRGIHAIFDHHRVAQILRQPTESLDFFNLANLEKIQNLFTQFIHCKTFLERQQFLLHLPNEDYETLVRTYFHILENTVLATSSLKH